MLTLLIAASVLAYPPGSIERDAFGVPKISAPTPADALYWVGRAVAEDRLWQMEMSRRSARGRMAEVFGKSALAADTQTLLDFYTDEELEQQFKALSPSTQAWLDSYAQGVNDVIAARKANSSLPDGYAANGFEPEPWTHLDSMAIQIKMARLFGGGGEGELRNFALVQYLKTQPCKNKVLDVIDDLAWQNDPSALCTVSDADDPQRKDHYKFPAFTRQDTEKQLSEIPNLSLLELLPAIRMVTQEDAKAIALANAVPYKTGSYCMVVSPTRSKEGLPFLLSGPQMGHSEPAIIHEMSIQAGELNVTGLDVPGVPGVVVGMTPNLAWGLTTAVADSSDIFMFKTDGADSYSFNGKKVPFQRLEFTIKVKGQDPVKVTQTRTLYGPVVLLSKSSGVAMCSRTTFWGKECASLDTVYGMYKGKTVPEFLKATYTIPVGFNVFCADKLGNIGWRFCGQVPIRAEGLDPRFPTPATPENDWKGVIPPEKMPFVINPGAGLIVNWNNKPVSWWPNLDTPAWGRIFRNEMVARNLAMPKIGVDDLERAAWSIARQDSNTCGQFQGFFESALKGATLSSDEKRAAATLSAYDSWQLDGSQPALVSSELVKAVRRELFLKATGNFTSDSIFSTAVQPTVIWNALEGKTKFPFLSGRTRDEVIRTSFSTAVANLSKTYGSEVGNWRWKAGGFPIQGQAPVPYGDRGSYIQIVELRDKVIGRSVIPPGESESGPHMQDQVPLARAWMYKPMWGFR